MPVWIGEEVQALPRSRLIRGAQAIEIDRLDERMRVNRGPVVTTTDPLPGTNEPLNSLDSRSALMTTLVLPSHWERGVNLQNKP